MVVVRGQRLIGGRINFVMEMGILNLSTLSLKESSILLCGAMRYRTTSL